MVKLVIWLGRILAVHLAPQELVDLAIGVWPQVWRRIPQDQRVDFLKSAAKKHLGAFLRDLNREERAALMNALLPLAAREFPLTDLDFLAAFPFPGEGYLPQGSLPKGESRAGV